MRLTVCLEGNTEGKVLASIDMEEIVKMTITDDIEKSNFNPQMLKSCTDSAYQCGYQQGRKDGIAEANLAHNIECGDCVRQITATDEERIRADEREKVINEVKQYLLKHKKTVKEFETKHIYDAVKIEWIIDLKGDEQK